jgi:ABC-type Fe3+ transport system permease subunit
MSKMKTTDRLFRLESLAGKPYILTMDTTAILVFLLIIIDLLATVFAYFWLRKSARQQEKIDKAGASSVWKSLRIVVISLLFSFAIAAVSPIWALLLHSFIVLFYPFFKHMRTRRLKYR